MLARQDHIRRLHRLNGSLGFLLKSFRAPLESISSGTYWGSGVPSALLDSEVVQLSSFTTELCLERVLELTPRSG